MLDTTQIQSMKCRQFSCVMLINQHKHIHSCLVLNATMKFFTGGTEVQLISQARSARVYKGANAVIGGFENTC